MSARSGKTNPPLHDLVLSETAGAFSFHCVAVANIGVFDEGQTERTTAVLVSSELG